MLKIMDSAYCFLIFVIIVALQQKYLFLLNSTLNLKYVLNFKQGTQTKQGQGELTLMNRSYTLVSNVRGR